MDLNSPLVRLLILGVAALLLAATIVIGRWIVAKRTQDRLGLTLERSLPLEHAGAPTVVYFYSRGCAACASQKAALATLSGTIGRLNLLPVDAAGRPELASWAGVLTVPSTAVVDRARRLRHVNHGFRSADDLAAQIRPLGG